MNLLLLISLIILSTKYNIEQRFKIAEFNNDLRYIEHAFEFKNNMYLEPMTNSINPPIYPFVLYLFNSYFDLYPKNIIILQWILLSISLIFLSIELFRRYKSYSLLLSIYIFTYINPIFIFVNDGAVFPEFFTAIILFFLIAFWLRYLRLKNLLSLILLSLISSITMLTRYEFTILVGLIFIFLVRKFCFKSAFLYLVLPGLFISFNVIKNYLIFDEILLFSYSPNETKYGGVTSDGSWHFIDTLNGKTLISSKYLKQWNSIYLDSNIVVRIKKKNELFNKMYIDRWQNESLRLFKLIPCKVFKLYIPPPYFDLYTCCPEPDCVLKFYAHFNENIDSETNNLLLKITTFIFHFLLLTLTIVSILFHRNESIFNSFLLFVLIYSVILVVFMYGLPRFSFNFYPIFITIQALIFKYHA